MGFQVGFNRQGRGAQRLGDDLTAIQATPWILRARPNEDIGAMWGKFKHHHESIQPIGSNVKAQ